jgi:hypothetical protein
MPLPSPKPPLEGMTWYSLQLVRKYPYNPPNFPDLNPITTTLQFEVEFVDEEAAKRLEDKMRKLLQDDHMEVTNPLDKRPNGFDIDDGPGLPPV